MKKSKLYRGKRFRTCLHFLKANLTTMYAKEINSILDDILMYEKYIDDDLGVLLLNTRMKSIIIKLLEIRGWNYPAIDDYLTVNSYCGWRAESLYSYEKLEKMTEKQLLLHFVDEIRECNKKGVSIGRLDCLNIIMWLTYDKYMLAIRRCNVNEL